MATLEPRALAASQACRSPSRKSVGGRPSGCWNQSRHEPDEDDHGDELDERLGDHDQRGEVERRGQCEDQREHSSELRVAPLNTIARLPGT